MYHLNIFLIAVAVATAHAAIGDYDVPGVNTTIEEYPYQVSIANRDALQVCGGSLVTPQHVLTAAHCLWTRTPETTLVRVGATLGTSGGVHYAVETIKLHPDYKETSLDYDIAVIKLKIPVNITVEVQPISLAPTKATPRPGARLISTGWGLNPINRRRPPGSLKLEHVRTLKKSSCASIYAGIAKITSNMICGQADWKNVPTRVADMGGPIINLKGQLVGIVSWERLEPGKRHPGVYTSITSRRIQKFFKDNTK